MAQSLACRLQRLFATCLGLAYLYARHKYFWGYAEAADRSKMHVKTEGSQFVGRMYVCLYTCICVVRRTVNTMGKCHLTSKMGLWEGRKEQETRLVTAETVSPSWSLLRTASELVSQISDFSAFPSLAFDICLSDDKQDQFRRVPIPTM
ncbi:hypothetical protein STEG23_032743 [Scotinomys teguina]